MSTARDGSQLCFDSSHESLLLPSRRAVAGIIGIALPLAQQ